MEHAQLPEDLLLEIAARSDPATLVRCAAACKALRRGVAAPPFLRGLRLRHAAAGRFLPSLLRGYLFQRRFHEEGSGPRLVDPRRPCAPTPQPFRAFLSDSENADLFAFFEPAASRGGLVALRATGCGLGPAPAGVCDPATGLLNLFDAPAFVAQSHVLLTGACDGVGCSFRLLAAALSTAPGDGGVCCRLRTQAYSSDTGAWGAVTETPVPALPPGAMFVRAAALVLDGGAVHWLCRSSSGGKLFVSILTLTGGDASPTVTVMDIGDEEEGDDYRRLHGYTPEELLLVSSMDGRVSLLAVEQCGQEISLWTAPPAADSGRCRWTRQVVMGNVEEMIRQPGKEPPWSGGGKLELRWFGEKSGFVLARMVMAKWGGRRFFYFGIDLKSKSVSKICAHWEEEVQLFFPYEMDISYWRPSISPKYMD